MSSLRTVSVLAAFALSACAGDDAAKETGDTGDTGEIAGADLNGSWATACYEQTQTVLRYDELALTGTYTEYADESCTEAVHVSAWTGTAVVGDLLSSGARPLDLAFESFTSTPLTADNADLNNSYAYCGFTDWEASVEKDVLGADCYGFSIPVGGESLDIYAIDGDSLRFGAGAVIGTDLTEEDRPTTLDEQRVFTRVEQD